MGYSLVLTDDIRTLLWIKDGGLRGYTESTMMNLSGCESSGQEFLMSKSYAQHLHLVSFVIWRLYLQKKKIEPF